MRLLALHQGLLRRVGLAICLGATLSTPLLIGAKGGRASLEPLFVPESMLDFGVAGPVSTFSWKFTVSNRSLAAVKVTDIHQSCNCTSIEPTSFLLAPNQQQLVTVSLDLSADQEAAFIAAERPFSVALTPECNDKGVIQSPWIIHGKVLQPYQIEPTHVSFSDLVVNDDFPEASVIVHSHQQLKSLSARSPSNYFDVAVSKSNRQGRDWTLSIQVAPRTPIGEYSTEVPIVGVSETGRELPTVPLRIHAVVRNDVIVDPGVLAFGVCKPGGKSVKECRVRSVRGRNFNIERLIGDSAVTLRCNTRTLKASEGVTIEVTLQPESLGFHSDSAAIELEDQETGQRLTVPFRYCYSCSEPVNMASYSSK